MPAIIERPRRELVGQVFSYREVAVAVETSGVREQQRSTRPTELVDRHADMIGGGDAHRVIMPMSATLLRIVTRGVRHHE